MISYVDCDVFGKASRLGRAAADALVIALDGGSWDSFHAAKAIDVVVAAAGGIPSLPLVLSELDRLERNPLLAKAMRPDVLDRIDDGCRSAGGVLDSMLMRAAQAAVLRGDHDAHAVLSQLFRDVLDRAIVTPRGGLIDQVGPARSRRANRMLAPLASKAAGRLLARPDAKRLSLARAHNPSLVPESNLLGGGP